MHIVRRSSMTLIEILIVMALITMIIGVVGVNYRSSLERGRAATTRVGIEKLRNILLDRLSDQPQLWDSIESEWQEQVAGHPLANNPKALVRDGWGDLYQVNVEESNGSRDLVIRSSRYEQYLRDNPSAVLE